MVNEKWIWNYVDVDHSIKYKWNGENLNFTGIEWLRWLRSRSSAIYYFIRSMVFVNAIKMETKKKRPKNSQRRNYVNWRLRKIKNEKCLNFRWNFTIYLFWWCENSIPEIKKYVFPLSPAFDDGMAHRLNYFFFHFSIELLLVECFFSVFGEIYKLNHSE